jgi:hypothetical protein
MSDEQEASSDVSEVISDEKEVMSVELMNDEVMSDQPNAFLACHLSLVTRHSSLRLEVKDA